MLPHGRRKACRCFVRGAHDPEARQRLIFGDLHRVRGNGPIISAQTSRSGAQIGFNPKPPLGPVSQEVPVNRFPRA
jgi:hypothetical protein